MAKAQVDKPSQGIVEEIRSEYEYYEAEWSDIRDEARKDMRCVAGDPWEPSEKEARKDAQRPCLSADELSQYINQLVNDPRQNPRAVKINPKGNGADDKTAQVRENLIRDIQYNSRAQGAFTTGFQGAVERSYGFWRVGARYSGDEGFEQELYIGRIPNPDSVLFHPNFKEPDCSDAMGCFVLDKMRRADYRRKYPDSNVVDFTPDQTRIAPQWIENEEIMVAEYFKVAITNRKLFLVEQKKAEPIALYEDELPEGFDKNMIRRERTVEKRSVTQYITNGIEVLEETPIPIPWIPIVPVWGKEIYVDEGGGSKRKLLSLIRLARDPFMMYCYLISQEAEEAGMSPKVPIMGYTGQFETDKESWKVLNKIARAYIQIDPVLDASGQQVLPLPQWRQFVPNFQAYEVAIEGARRRIQAAMGINSLPTAAQRQNEKSGKALEKIESQEDRGSFHFIDNYNHALEHTGRILDAWIPVIYDTARDVGVREADETHKTIRINDPSFTEPNDQGISVPQHYDTTSGDHGVTVSVGPSFESQRSEANDLVQTIVGNIEAIAPLLPPGAGAKLVALALRLKNGGPLVEEMADIIAPPPDEAAQEQAMAQGQQQLQQSQEIIQKLQEELGKLKLEKAGKVIDNEYALQLAKINNDVKVLIANTTTMQQDLSERMQMFQQYWSETHGAAHETAMQSQQHAHESSQAQVAQSAASQQSSQDHGQNLEQTALAQSATSDAPNSEEGQ